MGPRLFLDDETYPVGTARIEVGFDLGGGGDHDHYWINWIEPDRDVLLGWHQDDDHPDLGSVHVQVSQGGEPVAHAAATFVDAHPMAVLETRIQQVGDSLTLVESEGDAVVGIDW